MSWVWLDKQKPRKEEGRLCFRARKHLLIKFRKQPGQKLTALPVGAAKESAMKNKGSVLLEGYHRGRQAFLFKNQSQSGPLPHREPFYYGACTLCSTPAHSGSSAHAGAAHRFLTSAPSSLFVLQGQIQISTDYCCPSTFPFSELCRSLCYLSCSCNFLSSYYVLVPVTHLVKGRARKTGLADPNSVFSLCLACCQPTPYYPVLQLLDTSLSS